MLLVITATTIVCAGLPGFMGAPSPEALRMAKRTQAQVDARLAGLQVTDEQLEASGWEPGDDIATIRKKLGVP